MKMASVGHFKVAMVILEATDEAKVVIIHHHKAHSSDVVG